MVSSCIMLRISDTYPVLIDAFHYHFMKGVMLVMMFRVECVMNIIVLMLV